MRVWNGTNLLIIIIDLQWQALHPWWDINEDGGQGRTQWQKTHPMPPPILAGIWWILEEWTLVGRPAIFVIPVSDHSGGTWAFWNWDQNGMQQNPVVCLFSICLFIHCSHPILGTYEVIQFFELVNLEGTPFQCGIWAPYQFHDTMGWKSYTISLSFQYHVTSYHTIGMIEAFHFQSKPYHHSKAVTGCLGSFVQNMKSISAGCNPGPLGSIFCGHTLQIFTDIWSYKWRLYCELDPWKISSIELDPRFWPFTLWIIHHKPLKIVYLIRPFNWHNIHHT